MNGRASLFIPTQRRPVASWRKSVINISLAMWANVYMAAAFRPLLSARSESSAVSFVGYCAVYVYAFALSSATRSVLFNRTSVFSFRNQPCIGIRFSPLFRGRFKAGRDTSRVVIPSSLSFIPDTAAQCVGHISAVATQHRMTSCRCKEIGALTLSESFSKKAYAADRFRVCLTF